MRGMAKLISRLIEFAIFLAIAALVGAANGAALAFSPWLLIASIPASLLAAVAMWLTTLATIDRWLLRHLP